LSYKRSLIRLLDRPGGRFVLGKIATGFLRQISGPGVEIAYVDGLWTRRVGRYFFPDGITFDYNYADFGAWRDQVERYASDTTDYWLQHYRPRTGDVIVDVGAGRGEDTLTFSQGVGSSGRVIAIEAHPLSCAILKGFCRLNRLANVTPLHLALMDRSGTVRIAESSGSWMENTTVGVGEVSAVQVRASTLDEICERQRLGTIAFLKMNIEGAERYALPGMESVMQRIRHICIACHDFRSELGHGEQYRTRAFVEQFLLDHGFALASRPGDPRDFVRDHVFGLRRTLVGC
jgi:FkbM family methyltransferase